MRQGLLFYGNLSLADTVAVGREAEEGGFDSLHYVEAYRSPFVALAALANATRRVRLGSYIANAYAHSPFGMGLAGSILDELSGGRFVLGVGSGNQHLDKLALGVGRDDVHMKLREFVEVVRRMVNASEGGQIAFEGKIHSMRWRQTLRPFRERIPVHLAAIFPKMIDVAATVADGVALGVLASPEYVREIIRPRIRRAAEAAGRDPGTIEHRWVRSSRLTTIARERATQSSGDCELLPSNATSLLRIPASRAGLLEGRGRGEAPHAGRARGGSDGDD